MNTLNQSQREQFINDGFTVASGLIPADIIETTLNGISQAMSIKRDDKSTWPEGARGLSLDTVDLTTSCFTPALNAAARELVGDMLLPGQCISSVLDRQGKDAYVPGFIPVLAYPQEGEKKFVPQWPGGFHVDGIHFASLWPDKMLLVALIYLTDTTEYGGATAVIPGSHRQIFEHWIKKGETPSHEVLMAGIENPQPVPVPGKAGDVIFMHHLMAHSGTPNHDDHIRFALNANFTRDPQKEYEKKDGAPQEDWTPLNWTLRTDNIVAG